MEYINAGLPAYPVITDIWADLSKEKRPIMVYGMGNGADKLFSRFEKYGIIPKEIFASDGFVRGHSYRGMKVRAFSEIRQAYDEFVIVVSFASNRPEVISLIKEMAREYTVYIPDMPVAGEKYFDSEFYNANYESILRAYNALADERSRALYASMIRYKLTADPNELFAIVSDTDEILSFVKEGARITVDAGAYNGDTVKEMLERFISLEKIYAIEPDRRNYRKLTKYIDENGLSDVVIATRAAVWSENAEGAFTGSGNRNSSVDSFASYKSREEEVPLRALDTIVDDNVDYIKYDVEGAELRAIKGSNGLIWADRPTLLVSAYHRSEDIFSLVNYIAEEYPFYELYMRRTECFPAWEIAILAVEK